MSYEKKADEIWLTPDALTGQTTDIKTFRGLAALNRFANSAFKKKRSRIGITMANTLVETILPALQKKWKKAEDFIKISGFEVDIQMFETTIIRDAMTKFILEYWKKNKKNPTEAEKQAFNENLITTWQKEGIKLPAKPIFDIKWGMRADPVNEYEDKEEKNLIYSNIFDRIGQNPAYINIPAFRQWCQNNGVSPIHFTTEQAERFMISQQSAPAAPDKPDKLMSTLEKE